MKQTYSRPASPRETILEEAEGSCIATWAFVPFAKITNRCRSMPPFLASLSFVLIDSICAGFSRAMQKHSLKSNPIQR
jgi:hypothetical protein